ncbi:hypothetical protein [Glutamicibacter sp. NPDC087344]|uniref:hypothetical protein n=1 Tax=Glutamicibacter sp. NPDC087344 TaxID=3363994 RepID=UPI0038095223
MAAAALTASAVASVPSRRSARLIPPRNRVLGWAAASSAVVHLVVLALIPHSLPWAVLLVAMTLWCLKCSWCVLRGGSSLELLGMCAAMGAAHIAMVIGMPWFAGHHSGSAGHSASHVVPMLLIALMEFALMFAAALVARGQLSTGAPGTRSVRTTEIA